MAVICTQTTNTALSGTNNFWRVEDHRLYINNAQTLALSSTRTINLTFANAGNLRKVGLCLHSINFNSASDFQDVRVRLIEGASTVRDEVTLTGTEIWNGFNYSVLSQDATSATGSANWITFEGFDYPVTTASGTWKLEVLAITGTGTQVPNLRTVNGTIPVYFAVCDNAVTAANGDVIISDKVVTIDQSIDLGTVLTTSDSSNTPVAAIACNSKEQDPELYPRFVVPSGINVDITIRGLFILSQCAGIRIGNSEADPVTLANKVNIFFDAPSSGTNTPRFSQPTTLGGNQVQKAFFGLYGQSKNTLEARVTAPALIGATSIDVDDVGDWANGDIIAIGSYDGNNGSLVEHEITGISGNTITFTPALAGANRKAGGKVLLLSGKSISMVNDALPTTSVLNAMGHLGRFEVIGVELKGITFQTDGNLGIGSLVEGLPEIYRKITRMENCSARRNNSAGGTVYNFATTLKGFKFNNINYYGVPTFGAAETNGLWSIASKFFQESSFTNVNILNLSVFSTFSTARVFSFVGDNIYFERTNSGGSRYINLSGANHVLKNSEFITSRGTGAFVGLDNSAFVRVENCSFENAVHALSTGTIGFIASCVGVEIENCDFTNNVDFAFASFSGCLNRMIFRNCDGDVLVRDEDTYPVNLYQGNSQISVVNNNLVPNFDFNIRETGEIYRTGTGLPDTTSRSGFALRLTNRGVGDPITWRQLIPTGDISGKDMAISLFCKINNSNYWLSPHQKPKLRVVFDDGANFAEAEAEETTDWQKLSVPFSPTTDYPEVEFIFSIQTDAADEHVYVDDVAVFYPPGVTINLGNLDLWANAFPVAPAISTGINAADVWAADPSTFGNNTVGELQVKMKKETGLIPGLL
jgi:hypothetical protein